METGQPKTLFADLSNCFSPTRSEMSLRAEVNARRHREIREVGERTQQQKHVYSSPGLFVLSKTPLWTSQLIYEEVVRYLAIDPTGRQSLQQPFKCQLLISFSLLL